jgi:SagB-type dehydrogenase family enzyme
LVSHPREAQRIYLLFLIPIHDWGCVLSGGGVDGPESISVSELYHENSKQRRHDASFGARIALVTSSPPMQALLAHAYKKYGWAERTPLPSVEKTEIERVIADRRSSLALDGSVVRLDVLTALLRAGYGVTGLTSRETHGTSRSLRSAPSAGALYPLELYVVTMNVSELVQGLYHYLPPEDSLELLLTGDLTEPLIEATAFDETVGRASAVVVITCMFQRSRVKYGERGYRFALVEAGHVAQNVLLAAAARGVGAVPIGGFLDESMHGLLGVDGVEEACLYLIPIGGTASRSSSPQVDEQIITQGVLSKWRNGNVRDPLQ